MSYSILQNLFNKCQEIYYFYMTKFTLLSHDLSLKISQVSPKILLQSYIILLLVILLLIITNVVFLLRKKKQPSFKKLISILPVKICYWQEEGTDYFIHQDISMLLKSSLSGYSLIQFVLTYNQEISDEFTKIQNNTVPHIHVLIPNLNVNVYITKHEDYFFMILEKLDQNNESLLTSSINTLNTLVWIEVENIIVFTNEVAKKYINTITTIKDGMSKNIVTFDGNLYKYVSRNHPSYTIYTLTEINEFRNFQKQEQQNEVLYSCLEFLREKFVIMSRDGKILFISNGFKTLVDLKTTVYTITDLFAAMQNNLFLPDQADFKKYMSNMKNNIYFCEEPQSEYFVCLDGRMLSNTIIPNNNYIMMVFEDISQQIASKRESIQNKHMQDFYWNNMDEGIVVYDQHGNLLFHNPQLKDFVNEGHISTKQSFEEHLKVKDAELGVYITTSLYSDKNFVIIKNSVDNLDIFILKNYHETPLHNNLTDFFYKVSNEIDMQLRYLDYINNDELSIKKTEQLNLVYKSVYRLKAYTYSNIDYYENPQILNLKTINIIAYIKSYIKSVSNIYNISNLKTEYNVDEYMVTIDMNLLQRCMMYLLEFFYGFFLTQNKTITIKSERNTIFFEVYVEDKYDFKNFNNTRLLFVLQKLLHFMKFDINLEENDEHFTLFIKYSQKDE